MQCTACRIHSNNLREYSRVVTIREHRKSIETAYLCPACRVMNALNPRYVVKQTAHELHVGDARCLPLSRVGYVASFVEADHDDGDIEIASEPRRHQPLPC